MPTGEHAARRATPRSRSACSVCCAAMPAATIAEPGARRRHDDPVELVQPRVLDARAAAGPRAACARARASAGVEQVASWGDGRTGAPSHSRIGVSRRHAARADLRPRRSRRRRSVGTFSAAHRPGGARAGDRVAAEVERLLDACRARTPGPRSAASSDSDALGSVEDFELRVVAAQGEHAAARVGAGEVAVADRVGGAVDARRLAVPDAEHAVVARARQRRRPSASPRPRSRRAPRSRPAGGRGRPTSSRAAELLVEAAERRALVAGDAGCAAASRRRRARWSSSSAHERLDAGEEDRALLELVAVRERRGGTPVA